MKITEEPHRRLSAEPSGRRRIVLREATDEDRESIYRSRHDIYAVELGQHPANPDGRLTNQLDRFNRYIVARLDGVLAGYVSITPPGGSGYSLDNYLPRGEWPFDDSDSLYEVRLLTVLPEHRGTLLASALMYAAFRWVETRGGERLMAIGRTGVAGIYRRCGMHDHGIEVAKGKVTFQVMSAPVSAIREAAEGKPGLVARIEEATDWQLAGPPNKPAACFHGGGFFKDVGERFQTLAKRYEVLNADVLDAWFPPAPGAMAALREHLDWLIRTSPPTGCEGMVHAIAEARGVPPACILPGAGSSDLIFLALNHWLTGDSKVLVLDPTYGEYSHVGEQVHRCQVERFTLRPEDDFQVDAFALGERLGQGDIDLAILVNPNSPTGQHLARHELEALLGAAPRTTRFWIDETYVEYVGSDQSVESFASRAENVVVCKSMSKVYALSGARAAYLCGSPATLEPLRALTPPWAVSLPGQVAAVKALEDPAYYRAKYEATHAAREELAEALGQLGLRVLPGVANFLLTFLPKDGPTAREVVARCRESGVHLRDAANMGSQLGAYALRTAVKSPAENERIVAAIKEALGQSGAAQQGSPVPRERGRLRARRARPGSARLGLGTGQDRAGVEGRGPHPAHR